MPYDYRRLKSYLSVENEIYGQYLHDLSYSGKHGNIFQRVVSTYFFFVGTVLIC